MTPVAAEEPIASQRAIFDLPRDLVYLNAAYMTPWPKRFLAIADAAARQRLHPWEIGAEEFFAPSEEVRALAARLFDAPADAIAIQPAVSYAVATAARVLPLARGQVILTLAEEFPSNYYGWARRARETGAELVVLDGPADCDWTARVLEAIEQFGERVAVAALPNVHWASGIRLDLVRIRTALDAVGAALFVDVSQSLGALPFSVRAVRPDFATTVGYKWLFGPYALGFTYVAERWWDAPPLEDNWIVRAGAEDFRRLVDYQDRYMPGARRYDMGERSQFLAMPLAKAALELVLGWGPERTARTLAQLSERIIALFAQAGFDAPPAELRAPHLFGLRHESRDVVAVHAALAGARVLTSARGELLRVAPHLWIDEQDLARLAEVLAGL
ncbi:MAG: aminotransferase [Rhodothalassiaceae bacterium]|nr:MAG: aminotransferase [Rhodothalassiaceae bacterium]